MNLKRTNAHNASKTSEAKTATEIQLSLPLEDPRQLTLDFVPQTPEDLPDRYWHSAFGPIRSDAKPLFDFR